tara:strand:- start:104 stop:304 length:201 start_codon:yes stop_codon:yes gene_type:complete
MQVFDEVFEEGLFEERRKVIEDQRDTTSVSELFGDDGVWMIFWGAEVSVVEIAVCVRGEERGEDGA